MSLEMVPDTGKSKLDLCYEFFEKLAKLLGDKYEMVPSCNKDASRYLVPKGTTDQITYYGKPDNSFRVSDHWNWYSNLKKCSDPNYVQCWSVDVPNPRKRPSPACGTNGRMTTQVCIQLTDGKYHHVYGEKFDKKTKTWGWVENDPAVIIELYNL